MVADARHRVRDGHARQASAAVERRAADACHGVYASVVRDSFRNDHAASVFIWKVVSITSTITDRQLCIVIRPGVIDSYTITIRDFYVVCSRLNAYHAYEQGEQECNV